MTHVFWFLVSPLPGLEGFIHESPIFYKKNIENNCGKSNFEQTVLTKTENFLTSATVVPLPSSVRNDGGLPTKKFTKLAGLFLELCLIKSANFKM